MPPTNPHSPRMSTASASSWGLGRGVRLVAVGHHTRIRGVTRTMPKVSPIQMFMSEFR